METNSTSQSHASHDSHHGSGGKLWRLIMVAGVTVAAVGGIMHMRSQLVQGGRVPLAESALSSANAEVMRSSTVRAIRLPGQVRSTAHTTISSRIMARITELNVDAGDHVTKGQQLALLDDRDLKAKLQATQAQLEGQIAREQNARQMLSRMQSLDMPGAVSKQDIDNQRELLRVTEAQCAALRQSIEELNVNLTFTRIVAPADGVIIDRRMQVGDTASPGMPILEFFDPAELRFEAAIPESLVDRLQASSLSVELGTSHKAYSATVHHITPSMDPASRSVLVRFNLPKGTPLFDGAYGELLLPGSKVEQLLIPTTAVYSIGQVDFVDVLVDSAKAVERRVVRLGDHNASEVECLSGLSAGERVVVRESH